MENENIKEFSIYTKKALGVKESYAIIMNTVSLGIDEKEITENASSSIFFKMLRSHKNKRILIVCGNGGKGGIGFGLARRLINYSEVKVALIGEYENLKPITKLNYELFSKISKVEIINFGSLGKLKNMIKTSDVVVDAIIGIGMKGRIMGLEYNVIKMLNESKKHVLSIDLPTGVDADNGTFNKAYVKADEVFTLYKMKKGILKNKLIRGTVVIDSGIPFIAELLTGPGDVFLTTEKKDIFSNKFSSGSLLVIGGSEKYQGAPMLSSFSAKTSLAALRTGAGYVTALVPKKIEEFARKGSDGIIINAFNNNKKEFLDMVKKIKHKALVIGPGMENAEGIGVAELLKYEFKEGNKVIIDGGALKHLGKYKNMLNKNTVITPHEGEFKEFSGINIAKKTFRERIKIAVNLAKSYNCVVVLKGHITIITNGDLLKINEAKTPALATMGTGDILSGIIGAYCTMHKDPFECSTAGVYIHSNIGDKLYETKGNHIIAQDIIDMIPEFLKDFDVIG